jgi:hypothetical protein
MEIFKKLMVPKSTAAAIDNATIATLAFNLAWMHRTFTEVFPDNTGTIGTSLKNFLAIPLQFSITAHQLFNYTFAAQSPSSSAFAIPESMITTAYGGRSIQRLAVQPWTGWLFIATQIVILAAVLVNIIWIMREPPIRDSYAHLPELDTLARERTITCYNESSNQIGLSLKQLALQTRNKSSWQGASDLRGWRFTVAAAPLWFSS